MICHFLNLSIYCLLALKVKFSEIKGNAAAIAHCWSVRLVIAGQSQNICYLIIFLLLLFIFFSIVYCDKTIGSPAHKILTSWKQSKVSVSICIHLSKCVLPFFTSSFHCLSLFFFIKQVQPLLWKVSNDHFGCASERQFSPYIPMEYNQTVVLQFRRARNLHWYLLTMIIYREIEPFIAFYLFLFLKILNGRYMRRQSINKDISSTVSDVWNIKREIFCHPSTICYRL